MAARNRENNFYKESWEEHFTLSMMGNITAGLGFKMAALNSKWRVCDVIVTSRHVIVDTSKAQSVKLMTCYKRAKFHCKSFHTFRDLFFLGVGGGGTV